MPRITREECSYLDVEWYGVDRKGQIAAFCSAGESALPEFVCEDAKRVDMLAGYFGSLPSRSGSRLFYEGGEQANRVARTFSGRGLFYFDADGRSKPGTEKFRPSYTRVSAPLKPLYYRELPEQIRALLRYNFLETDDFSETELITVKHAYRSIESTQESERT